MMKLQVLLRPKESVNGSYLNIVKDIIGNRRVAVLFDANRQVVVLADFADDFAPNTKHEGSAAVSVAAEAVPSGPSVRSLAMDSVAVSRAGYGCAGAACRRRECVKFCNETRASVSGSKQKITISRRRDPSFYGNKKKFIHSFIFLVHC